VAVTHEREKKEGMTSIAREEEEEEEEEEGEREGKKRPEFAPSSIACSVFFFSANNGV
jgi:hypothetical protein